MTGPLGFIVGPDHGTIVGHYGGPKDGTITQGPMALRPEEAAVCFDGSDGYEVTHERRHADDGSVCYVHLVWKGEQ